MKKQLALFTAIALSTIAPRTFAQKTSETLKVPPANVKIDGNLRDWGDSLRYHNEEKKLDYSLANDQDNLYMAIRLSDHTEQMRVLAAGLTVSINTKGKKKEEYSITFPVGDQGSAPGFGRHNMNMADSVTQADRDELMRARLTRLRNIKVVGFPDIEGDMITTSNTYGIHTAIDYDANGYLVYEAAIPLKFFHTDPKDKKEWAFDFKINGINRQAIAGGEKGSSEGMGGGGMGRGGRGGMGGSGGMHGGGGRGGMRGGGGMGGGQYSGGSDHSEMSKSVDFWEKFYLGGQ